MNTARRTSASTQYSLLSKRQGTSESGSRLRLWGCGAHCLTALVIQQLWVWGDLPLSLGLSQLSISTGAACRHEDLLPFSGITAVKLASAL